MKQSLVLALAVLLAACSPSSRNHASASADSAASAKAPAVADTVSASATGEDQPDEVVPPVSARQMTAQRLAVILHGAWRPAADKARDRYRHPLATLQFFGIRPDMTVIEVEPGGGWYARILAPFLRQNGQYVAAVFAPGAGARAPDQAQRMKQLFAADPAVFGKLRLVQVRPDKPVLGAPGSADMVLTFRNVHDWVQAGHAAAMFRAFYQVLRPGGVLGVVDHRAAPGATLAAVKGSGYLPQSYVVGLATAAGFRLQASSPVNANPADDHHHPRGVWTLPPTLALGTTDRARYVAIGESDRMTLRFVKPVPAPAPAHGVSDSAVPAAAGT